MDPKGKIIPNITLFSKYFELKYYYLNYIREQIYMAYLLIITHIVNYI